MKPTNLQVLSRVLTKKGWHPKHIGGLIRSKYEGDYGWGNEWSKYDAATRANGWARIYCGMIYTGADRGYDQNCGSHQQRNFCIQPNCGYNLGDFNPQKEELEYKLKNFHPRKIDSIN